jgi:hypothetical protein
MIDLGSNAGYFSWPHKSAPRSGRKLGCRGTRVLKPTSHGGLTWSVSTVSHFGVGPGFRISGACFNGTLVLPSCGIQLILGADDSL